MLAVLSLAPLSVQALRLSPRIAAHVATAPLAASAVQELQLAYCAIRALMDIVEG